MIDKTLLRQVRRIEIRTRRAMTGPLAGLYASAFKGRGLDFEEVRAYQPGDDLRTVDWKVTARRGEPFVKRFSDERQRTFWLVIDRSASMDFGSTVRTKRQTAVEAAAVIALASAAHQDRVGMVAFGGPSQIVGAAKGSRHALRIVRDLLVDRPATGPVAGNLATAVERLRRMAHRRAIVFVISDFLFDGADRQLGPLHGRHQVFALRIVDPLERRLPAGGLVRWRDAETGEVRLVDTSDRAFRLAFQVQARRHEQELKRRLARWDIPTIALSTDESPAVALVRHWSSAR
jgi:uncharacterized protein (DUF58 family)